MEKKVYRIIRGKKFKVKPVVYRKIGGKAKLILPRKKRGKYKKTTAVVELEYSRVYIIGDKRADLTALHKRLKLDQRIHTWLFRISQKEIDGLAKLNGMPLELVYFGEEYEHYAIKVQIAGIGVEFAAQHLEELIQKQKAVLIPIWFAHHDVDSKLEQSLRYAGVAIRRKF